MAVEPPTLFDETGRFNTSFAGSTLFFGGLVDRTDSISLAKEDATVVAVTLVDNEGGLDGRRFAYVSCTYRGGDVEQSPTAAIQGATRWLTERAGVAAIQGPASSADTLTAFDVASPAGALLMSSSATSALLTAADADSLLWRTCPADSTQGVTIAEDTGAPAQVDPRRAALRGSLARREDAGVPGHIKLRATTPASRWWSRTRST